jgi:hypothetical protein
MSGLNEGHEKTLCGPGSRLRGRLREFLNLRGATLTLQLTNGAAAAVNCTNKFQERFDGPGNVRSCCVPLVDDLSLSITGTMRS